MAYLEREVISLCGKAVHGWRMISDGDRVAVGLSGGKDSLSLLWLLAERRRRVPIDYHLAAMHIEMGFGSVSHDELRDFCDGLGVELVIRHTTYGPEAHSPVNREKSPCFYCAMHRRRELFQMCAEHACGKLALAHHQDDIFETLMMNLLYAGNLGSMLPVQPFFRGEIVMIRPLALCSADQTRRFAAVKELPVQPPCCPSAGESRRQRVREMLEGFYHENKKTRASLWHAITTAGLYGLPTPPTTQRTPRSRRGRNK